MRGCAQLSVCPVRAAVEKKGDFVKAGGPKEEMGNWEAQVVSQFEMRSFLVVQMKFLNAQLAEFEGESFSGFGEVDCSRQIHMAVKNTLGTRDFGTFFPLWSVLRTLWWPMATTGFWGAQYFWPIPVCPVWLLPRPEIGWVLLCWRAAKWSRPFETSPTLGRPKKNAKSTLVEFQQNNSS